MIRRRSFAAWVSSFTFCCCCFPFPAMTPEQQEARRQAAEARAQDREARAVAQQAAKEEADRLAADAREKEKERRAKEAEERKTKAAQAAEERKKQAEAKAKALRISRIPKTPEEFVARFGKPTEDDSTVNDKPRPLVLTRWLIYRNENVHAFYIPEDGHKGNSIPVREWQLLQFQNAADKNIISDATVLSRMKQRDTLQK